ncbi:MAG TPA: phosphatidate cytidylyltransferase [Casimicrobiaceae bacterium]|nr:phosphatidate cytidylyltransferase [Casimicrobiaceae bacterium]
MRTRILTAAMLAALVLAALFLLPSRGWALLTLGLMGLAAYEWTRLVGFTPRRRVGFIAGIVLFGLVLLFAHPAGMSPRWPDGVVLGICLAAGIFWFVVAPTWLATQWSVRHELVMALVGWLVLIGAWVAIVELQARSPWLVLAAMAVVWIADTAAYFTGRKLGRRKLAPSISPNKSWEGVWGGVAAVAVYALLLTPFAAEAGYKGSRNALTIAAFVLLCVVLGVISVIGDLFESMMKRQAGVKDSGALLPGHGGVLDRIDALLSAMPIAAIAATLFLVNDA